MSRDAGKLSKALVEDYRAYIQQLLSENKYFIDENNIWFFEDGAGRHAVKIEIPFDGVWLEHVLIYDSANKRAKVIRYSGGKYRS